MVLYNLKPKLSDSFEKNLIVQRRCYKTQSPNKCHSRLSGIILKTKKDSEQVGMTKYRIAQLRYYLFSICFATFPEKSLAMI